LLHVGAQASKLAVVPAPVDVDLYAQATDDGIRAELDVSEAEVLITAVGHAVPVKGWDILIKAFADVAKEAGEARLILVGNMDGPEEADMGRQLRSLVGDLGLTESVRFLGRREDVPRILAASDIFAFPSRSDGQGLALTESMAAGLACVAASVGGIPELITDRQNGLLFSREDVKGLAQALLEVIRDKQMRESIGANARASSRRFSLEAATNRVIEIYDMLLDRRK
jgi:glycosyltransferase involved in cell wall biosynthesis